MVDPPGHRQSVTDTAILLRAGAGSRQQGKEYLHHLHLRLNEEGEWCGDFAGNLIPQDEALPFHFRVLEIDEQAEAQAGSPQIVQTLSRVLTGEMVGAFEFDDQDVFDHNVGEIFAHGVTFVNNGE